jgi:hypothetical protein
MTDLSGVIRGSEALAQLYLSAVRSSLRCRSDGAIALENICIPLEISTFERFFGYKLADKIQMFEYTDPFKF